MAVSLFNGCSDFLDKQPLGKLNESVLTDESTVNKLLIACYSPLNGFINGVWGITSGPDNVFYGDMCAGNIHKGSTTGDQGELLQMERYVATAENGRIRDKWILVYGAIERCNDVLRMLNDNKIDGLSEESEMEIRAEARFLRGYYHFEAKKIWNMVPYIDEYVEDPQRRVPNDKDIWLILRKTSLLLPEFYRIIRVSLEDLRKTPLKRSWPRLIYSSKNIAKQKFY